MVGFQPYNALPIGNRFKVTLKQGLQDLKQNRLDQDFAWTFNTPQLTFDQLPNPSSDPNPVDLQPQIKFNSNAEVNLTSLQANKTLLVNGAKSVPFEIKLNNPEAKNSLANNSADKFDPSRHNWQYILIPKETLAKSTKCSLAIVGADINQKRNLALIVARVAITASLSA